MTGIIEASLSARRPRASAGSFPVTTVTGIIEAGHRGGDRVSVGCGFPVTTVTGIIEAGIPARTHRLRGLGNFPVTTVTGIIEAGADPTGSADSTALSRHHGDGHH